MAVEMLERWKKRCKKIRFFSLMARPFTPPPPLLMARPLREEQKNKRLFSKGHGGGGKGLSIKKKKLGIFFQFAEKEVFCGFPKFS